MKLKILVISVLAQALGGCGTMSFGDTALDTIGVFIEANAIKQCYKEGGGREECESRP